MYMIFQMFMLQIQYIYTSYLFGFNVHFKLLITTCMIMSLWQYTNIDWTCHGMGGDALLDWTKLVLVGLCLYSPLMTSD